MISCCRVRFAFTAALGVCLASVTRPAGACSPAEEGWYFYEPARAPANGVLSVTITCDDPCEVIPGPSDFTLSGPSGDVPGTVTVWPNEFDRHFVFEPDAPLTEGQLYSIAVTGVHSRDDLLPDSTRLGLVPTPALTWSTPPAVKDEVIGINYPRGDEPVCCDDGFLTSCEPPCITPEIERVTTVSVHWDFGQLAEEERNQYAFRILREADPDPPWSYPLHALLELGEAEDSICYVLEVQRLIDGVIQQYPERCVERPADFGEFGILPTSPGMVAEFLSACLEPPPEYLSEWCSVHECAGSSATECRPCPSTTGGAGGAGGGAGDGGIGAQGGTTGATAGATGEGAETGTSAGASSTAGALSQGGALTRGGASNTSGRTSSTRGGAGGADDTTGATAGATAFEREPHPQGCGCTTPGGRRAPAAFGLAALGALLLIARRRRA